MSPYHTGWRSTWGCTAAFADLPRLYHMTTNKSKAAIPKVETLTRWTRRMTSLCAAACLHTLLAGAAPPPSAAATGPGSSAVASPGVADVLPSAHCHDSLKLVGYAIARSPSCEGNGGGVPLGR